MSRRGGNNNDPNLQELFETISKQGRQFRKMVNKGIGGGGGGGFTPRALGPLAGAGLAALLLSSSIVQVPAGRKAIIFNRVRGLREDRVLLPGLNFIIPWLEYAIKYDCRNKPLELTSSTGSRDLQKITLSLRVLFAPGKNLQALHRRLGPDYQERLMPNVCHEVMKAVVAKFSVSECLQDREAVSRQIADALAKRCEAFHVHLENVAVQSIETSQQYAQAVERKQVAQQDAEKAWYRVEQAKQDKKSKIVLAEAEADAATLLGKAMKNNAGYLKLKEMDTAKDIADIVARGSNRNILLDADTLLLNMKDAHIPAAKK